MTKSIEIHLHLKKRLYFFQLKRGIFIGDHLNNYTKPYANSVNVDEVIKDEDKAFVLLSSPLDDDFETFILTLINGKESLRYNKMSTAL